MAIRLGVINTIMGSDNLEESFQLAAQAGAAGVEVCYRAPNGLKVLGEPDHAQKLKTLCARYNLSVSSLGLMFLCAEPALTSSGPTVARAQQSVATAIEVAVAAGAGVVMVPFFGKNLIETDVELNHAIEALQPLAEIAEEKGVIIGVESSLTIAQNQYMLSHLSSDHVRVYYDTGNMLARKFDPADGIRQLGAKAIVMMHVKDVKLVDGAPPNSAVQLGEGNVQFRGVMQALKAVGYDGWLIMETPGGADPLANAKANLKYTRNLIDQG